MKNLVARYSDPRVCREEPANRWKERGSNRNGSFNFRLARSSWTYESAWHPAEGIVRPLNGVDIIRIIAGHAPLTVRHSSAAVRNVPRYQPRWYTRMAINSLARWLMGQEDNCGVREYSRKRNTRVAGEQFPPAKTTFSCLRSYHPPPSFSLFLSHRVSSRVARGKLAHVDGFITVVGSIRFPTVVRPYVPSRCTVAEVFLNSGRELGEEISGPG